MLNYKGFKIDSKFRIFKDGKIVFTAYWQMCFSLNDAKNQIDASVIAKEIFDKYPAVPGLKMKNLLTEYRDFENGHEDREKEDIEYSRNTV